MHFLDPAQVHALADAIDERYPRSSSWPPTPACAGVSSPASASTACNFLRGTVNVVEALTEVNGNVEIGPTKTGAHRTVSLPRFLVEMLVRARAAAIPSTPACCSRRPRARPLRRNFYRRHFKPAAAAAGLPEALRFHDLRHTCAAMLIAQGAHPKEIQERLGHSTIRLTFDRYGHLLPSLDERLRDGLENAYRQSQAAT